MQTQTEARQSAAEEVFNLRKRIDKHLRAGDTDEVSRLQLQISELQQKHGVTTGIGKDENEDRTAR